MINSAIKFYISATCKQLWGGGGGSWKKNNKVETIIHTRVSEIIPLHR